MRAIIIDNESAIVTGLKKMLDLFCSEVSIVGVADGVSNGLELIANTQPDLVFLDVEMGDGTGMDLLKKVGARSFQVIFITAYDHYAIDAFRFSAVDFLLKPIDPEELMRAVKKVQDLHQKNQLQTQLEVLLANLSTTTQADKKIVLKDAESIHVLRIEEIIRCGAEGSYTRFSLSDGREILVSRNLKEYEKLLDSFGFFRAHHSHLVNLQHIRRFDKSDGGTIVMTDKSSLPVSSRRKEALLKHLSRL